MDGLVVGRMDQRAAPTSGKAWFWSAVWWLLCWASKNLGSGAKWDEKEEVLFFSFKTAVASLYQKKRFRDLTGLSWL